LIEKTNQLIEINVCGQICPSTLLTTLREVNKHRKLLSTGELCLDILTDNHDSTIRICEAVGNMGYNVEVAEQGNYYRISIAKIAINKSL